MKYFILAILSIVMITSFSFAVILQQNDFTSGEEGTLPTNLWGEWDEGVDVIVVSLATANVPLDHSGGDGYVLRIGDLAAGGYNFAYTADTTNLVTADNAVEAWAYFDFSPSVTVERDYGVFLRCITDPTPDSGGKAIYSALTGYWFFVTVNSSWSGFVPTNNRAFILKRITGGWQHIGLEGLTDYTTGWHKLRLELVGNELKGYVDGNLEVTVQDTAAPIYTEGFAGMVYYDDNDINSAGAFDNFLWETIEPLSTSPTGSINVSIGNSVMITASGGSGTYTWSLSTTGIGSIDTTAGPTVNFTSLAQGSVILTVDDGIDQSSVTINVIPTSAPLIKENEIVIMRKLE